MARGAASKETVKAKILETFPNAFAYDKEIRIPMMEDGEEIQIKCVLTAAKINVKNGGDTAMPGAKPKVTATPMSPVTSKTASTEKVNIPTEPTAEEKQAVVDLISRLGLSK